MKNIFYFVINPLLQHMKRRTFFKNTAIASAAYAGLGFYACGNLQTPRKALSKKSLPPFFKLSLAQWSLHRAIQSQSLSPYDFAKTAKELGFEGVEYVNDLYQDVMKAVDKPKALKNFITKSNAAAKMHGVENVLIMVDGEGDLAVPNKSERFRAIENHKAWIEAAAEMECHSIRINLFGERNPEAWLKQSTESMNALGEYALGYNVNVIIENHGYLSSNAALVVQMLENIEHPNCGTLPDFGNFCLERAGGDRWEGECIKEYDRYKGVSELLPKAFAVSAKSHEFDENGNEIHSDYLRLLQMVKDVGYSGYIGVEYEGPTLSETEGILATKNLLLASAEKLV